MATQVQFRRGTTTQNNAFTGAAGEITYDTEVKTLRLHDGTSAGGGATLVNASGAQTLANKTISTGSIWQGNSVALGYGGTGSSLTAVAGAVAYSGASGFGLTLAGISGQLLQSGGSGSPTWISASGLSVGTALTATQAVNIDGGSAGYLPYQVDTNETGFIAPGASGTFLRSTGASTPPDWATASVTIGSTEIDLGATSTSVAGLTAIDATSGATSFFATSTSPVVFAGATSLTIGYSGSANSTTNINTASTTTGNTKTINIGTGGGSGSTTNINLGSSNGGTVTINKDLVVSGNVTINGTTTTINSTTLDVDDLNITVAKGAANSAAADGAGLTVDGASATLLYTHATTSWNFNKPIIGTTTDYLKLPVGDSAARPASPLAGMVRYNSEISSFEGYASGAWSSLGGVKSVDAFTYILAETSAGAGNGDLDFYAENAGGTAGTQVGQWNRTNLKEYTGTIVGTQTTQNVFNATATTVNAFGAGTAVTIGSTSGTTTIRNASTVLTGDLTVNGGDIIAGTTTFNLANTTATTLNIGGAATTLNIGSGATGATTTFAKNVTIVGNLTVQGTTTTEASSALTVSDSAVYLNDGATDNTKDIGLVGTYVATGTKYTGLVRDASDSVWKFFSAPTNAPTAGTTVDFTGATYDALKIGALSATNGTFTAALTYGGVTLSNAVTGTGNMVLSTSPTLTTPTIGVASATSINKVAITAPATSATLTIADGKTLTASNTLTFTGTDASSVAFGTGGTVAYTNVATLSSLSSIGTISTGTWQGSSIATTYTAAKVTAVNAGTGVSVDTTTGSVTVSIGQAVATGSNVQFNSVGVGTAGSGTAGQIRATNTIVSYYSDDRLKTRTGNIENALEKVLSLDGFHYHANETAVALGYDGSKEEVGLSAQQVQAVLPEVIAPAPIDPQYMTLHYERLVPLLVEAIKEQQKQIEELKAKLG